VDQRIGPDLSLRPDRDMVEDPRAIADPRAGTDIGEGADPDILAQLGAVLDHRRGVDARRQVQRPREDPADPRQHIARARREDCA